ncbi:MAG: hypothetical protein KA831_03350 [Pyrinomonadaceae bacterium]|nr:hypothetical protein [Pyrinomonadaceae bacterium]
MRTTLLFGILFVLASLALSIGAQVSTGGAYGMEQSVTASGGGGSNGPVYRIEGTAGQPAAGFVSSGGQYIAKGGFWMPVPTAQAMRNVSIGGRVLVNGGRGITNARVTLSGGNLMTPRIVFTGRYGLFSFTDIEAGHTYSISVQTRRFSFPQPTQMVSATDNITDIVFQATWSN